MFIAFGSIYIYIFYRIPKKIDVGRGYFQNATENILPAITELPKE